MGGAIPFLMYHELELPGLPLAEDSPGYRRYVVAEPSFRAHLATLADRGFTGVDVSRALQPGEAAAPLVALTFDDGNETDLTAAAPLLHERGWNATFFITTGFLGEPRRLTPAQLRELHDAGFEIGSHGVSHAFLSELSTAQLRTELSTSRERLEDMIGAPVVHLSCPGGRWNRRVVAEARAAGYASMATSRAALNRRATSRYALGRVPILRDFGNDHVSRLVSGRGLMRMRAGHGARRIARRIIGVRGYETLQSRLLGTNGMRDPGSAR